MNTISLFRTSEATHTVPPGQFIFREGDPGDCAYVLLEGDAEVVVKGLVVEQSRAGSLLGEMALIENQPRSASVRANTECKLVAIDERRFLFLIQQHPYFALQVMGIMAERLRRMNRELGPLGPGCSSGTSPD